MRLIGTAMLVMMLVAGCGDTATTNPPPTAEPPGTEASDPPATTAAPVTAAVPATTATLPLPTTQPPQIHEATVAWDGMVCSYEGPTTIAVGDTINITYVNSSGDVADFSIDYLITGFTIEDFDTDTGDFIDRATSVVPDFIREVAFYPGGRGSLGAGETATDAVVPKVARVHAFSCFGGQQSGDQTVDVADAGIEVTE